MATPVYSTQFVNVAGTLPSAGVVTLYTAFDTTTRSVVRDLSGGFVFGSSTDALTVSLQPGGSGSLVPLVTWDESVPNPITRELRVVMNTGDALVYEVTGSGSPAVGGLVISGYRLTLP